MRFTHIDINFEVRYEGHQNCPKILSMKILSVFSDHHLWCQNWCQYLWTSLCQFNFFVNLLHSLGVSFFDIWHLFDNLTSFWYFGSKLPTGPLSPCGSYPCTPLPMYPIADMAHIPCNPIPHVPLLPMCPIPLYPIPPVGLIAHMPHTPVPHCPCDPLHMWPIPPVPHCL